MGDKEVSGGKCDPLRSEHYKALSAVQVALPKEVVERVLSEILRDGLAPSKGDAESSIGRHQRFGDLPNLSA